MKLYLVYVECQDDEYETRSSTHLVAGDNPISIKKHFEFIYSDDFYFRNIRVNEISTVEDIEYNNWKINLQK